MLFFPSFGFGRCEGHCSIYRLPQLCNRCSYWFSLVQTPSFSSLFVQLGFLPRQCWPWHFSVYTLVCWACMLFPCSATETHIDLWRSWRETVCMTHVLPLSNCLVSLIGWHGSYTSVVIGPWGLLSFAQLPAARCFRGGDSAVFSAVKASRRRFGFIPWEYAKI